MGRPSKRQKPPFSINIIQKRKALGWNALKLAEMAKMPYPTLRDIEAGISPGLEENRMAIARALDCSMSELYTETPKEKLATAMAKQSIAEKRSTPSRFENLTWPLAADLLTYFQDAEPRRQLAALYILSKDRSFLVELANLPEGAQFAQVLEKLLRA